MTPLKATVIDDDKFALLAIPFSGPIPSGRAPRGVDLDGEWFSPRTDIKADWLPIRLVDWHHGSDGTLRRTVIGKADNLRMDEDGWWVDVWLEHGEKRLSLIRRLAERGAQLFGSSESVVGHTKIDKATGEILVWPYWRQTLSTSPQNTHSVLRSMKAALTDYLTEGVEPSDPYWSDIADSLRSLGASLRDPSVMGDDGAKAGRVLSAVNETDINEALTRAEEALERLRAVVGRQTPRKDIE